MNVLFFILVFMFNLMILVFKRQKFSFNNMGYLFLLYWIVNVVVAFVFFNSSVSWSFWGISFLFICVDVFSIVYVSIVSKQRSIRFSIESWKGKERKIFYLLLICFFAGIVYMILELTNNGFSLSNLTSVRGLMETGQYFTNGRYGDNVEIQISTIEQICLTINYSGFILAGYAFCLNLSKKWSCFIQFFPMIMSMLATTAKTTFISGIFLWLCGYLVAKNLDKINKEYGKKKISIRLIVIALVTAVLLFYFSFYIRYGSGNSTVIWNRIIMYAFGHVPCYDDWFSKFDTNMLGYSYGQQTFMMFFGNTMPYTLAKVYISPKFVTEYSWTNVITFFAYVIMDYGFIGSILFFCIFGFIAGLSIVLLRKKGSPFAHAISGLSYYIILYSFLVSPMRYLSIVGAFFLFGIYIFALLKIRIGVRG